MVQFGVICVQKVGAFGIIYIQQVGVIWCHMQQGVESYSSPAASSKFPRITYICNFCTTADNNEGNTALKKFMREKMSNDQMNN